VNASAGENPAIVNRYRSLSFVDVRAAVLAAVLVLTSCVGPVTKAKPDPSPAKGNPVSSPGALNRSVRQPNALTHEEFVNAKKGVQQTQSPSTDLPSFKEFATDLIAADRRIPADKKEPIYTAIFDQAGIRPTPDQFPGLNKEAVGPNAATLSQAYQRFPEKQRELSNLVEQLRRDATKIPALHETPRAPASPRTTGTNYQPATERLPVADFTFRIPHSAI
jgi:hypothetical protein